MEADRIKNEMLRIKEKEGRELEQEKVDKMVTNFFPEIISSNRARNLFLTSVCVFHDIQLASTIIWVHVLYLKLL